MKIKSIMSIMTFAALAAACTGNKQLGSGLNPDNLDTTYLPGKDFYMYATGGWQKANPLTPEYSRYGSFDVLQENNNKQLRSLIDSVSAMQNEPGSVQQKIADLYKSAMDSVTLNTRSMEDLKAYLACPDYQQSPDATTRWMSEVWPRLQRQGVDGLFNFYIGADEKDSKNNILSISQGGLTLGQKDYYLDEDSATVKIREAFVQYIQDLSRHMGFSDADAQRISDDVMRIETRLAKASRSMTELRDPEANYNKMSYDSLKTTYAGIDWDGIFGNFGITGLKDVIMGQPEALHEVEKVFAEESQEALQNVYLFHAMDMVTSYLDDETRNISFAFYGTAMSGRQEDRPRWKRAVASVEGCLGEALGQLYVAKYFPPAAKERMEKLVANLQVALGQRIDEQDWMSDETKKVAHEKLGTFYVKVGYPNKWKDYSTLEIGDSYLNNILACKEWAIRDAIATTLNKPVDKDKWYMTPQTVNAYYNPTTNEICFPAGILQPPFFDMNADDAFNYGAIGVVIGHEMTHGFDDQGSKYDKDGNLSQWWTEEDTKRFQERIEVMRKYFDNIEVLPGLNANGSFTLGENIADHGGLSISFQAFQNATAQNPLPVLDGFTPQQRFLLAYANVWGQNIREEEIRNRVKGDPHSLGKWRVDGQMPHLEAWYQAFGITEEDPMYIPVENRLHVW